VTAFIHLRNPFALSNWTLPVLELMMVAGAILALWYSICRMRRDSDPSNLALWFATVIYLFVVEIPLYFPNVFGVEDQLGVMFAHNAFTVQFLFERLPLYIVALHPAVVTLAFERPQPRGVPGPRYHRRRDLRRIRPPLLLRSVPPTRSPVVVVGLEHRQPAQSADACVGTDDECFHLRHPKPDRVTVLVMLLVGRKANTAEKFSGLGLTWRTVVAGASVPLVSPF
jgi:hypothetical protein